MRRMWVMVGLVLALTLVGAAPSGAAAVSGVFAGATVSGAAIPCLADSDGVRVCHGSEGTGSGDLRVRGTGGVPLDVWAIIPPAPSDAANDGGFPLIVQAPRWGHPAAGPDDAQYGGPTARAWARNGYAVLQITPRGFGDSCGPGVPGAERASGGVCAHGYTHLDDARYEGRDVQLAVGDLADAGVISPSAVAATGAADGGALALELATLRNRVMEPSGLLGPWRSPRGTPLTIAAAAPVDPWSDLLAALVPNGHTVSEARTGPSADLAPVGIESQTLVGSLEAIGRANAFESRADRDAALPQWFAALDAGAPYDKNPLMQHVVAELERYRSPFALLTGNYGSDRAAPAPLLLATGWGTEGYGAAEALRYMSTERALFPGAEAGLLAGDAASTASVLSTRMASFFAQRLRGGPAPSDPTVEAALATCPSDGAPTVSLAGPSLAALHPGQVTATAGGAQTVSSTASDPVPADPCVVAAAGAPSSGSGGSAVPTAGIATVLVPAASGTGYTVVGAPVLTTTAKVSSKYAVLLARLWDIDLAAGTRTLVTRGVLRLDTSVASGSRRLELQPTAWHVAAGHRVELELLGQDAPWARHETVRFTVTVRGTTLILPVHEPAGTPGLGVTVAPFGSRVPVTSARDGRRAQALLRRPAWQRRRVLLRRRAWLRRRAPAPGIRRSPFAHDRWLADPRLTP